MLKRLLKGIDPQISSFTRILQHKRDRLFRRMAPLGSGQACFYEIGLEKLGYTQSPESTLAWMLKEYVKLRDYNLDSQISVIEYRVFGNNRTASYPSFNSLEEWIAWRLPLAFPKHSFFGGGWTLEFYKFAKNLSVEHFV